MWPWMPLTVKRPLMVPRRPFLIMSPVRSTEVGSPTMHQSKRWPRWRSASQTTTVPSRAGPSSSLVSKNAMSMLGCGVCAKNSSQATTMAASEVFMSLAPRPNKWPSRCVGTKGSLVQAARSPVGTTSVWPANTKTWASVRPQRRIAHRLLTRPSAGPLSMASHTKPSGVKRCAIIGKQPWSFGVTEGRAMSASASRRVACGSDIVAGPISRATGR